MGSVNVSVQLTGTNGNTAKNQSLTGGDEHVVAVAPPVITGCGGKYQIVNTGATTLVVNKGATTSGGTVGTPIPAGGAELLEIMFGHTVYIYGASNGSYCFTEQ